MITIKELMSDVGSVVDVSAHMSTAIALMSQKRHSCVLVCDANTLVGILTERDIIMALDNLPPGYQLLEQQVTEFMTSMPVTVHQEQRMSDALRIVKQAHIRHLPVVDDDGAVVGVVTQTEMIKTYVRYLERLAQLESDNQRLQTLAQEDELLGIGNRRALDLEIILVEASAKRQAQDFAVVMIDVDWFKRYNDEYGHPEGDEALIQVTQAIKGSMRSSDSVYRYGGEELLMLLPHTTLEGARISAERARQAVADLELPHTKSPLGVVTVSAGAAATCCQEGWDADALIDVADQQLYSAKERGRNQVSAEEVGKA